MIKAIVYDKTANTQIGVMMGPIRVVGHEYPVYSCPTDTKLLHIMEDLRRDQKVLVLTYESGHQQIIPDRGVEKVIYTE